LIDRKQNNLKKISTMHFRYYGYLLYKKEQSQNKGKG